MPVGPAGNELLTNDPLALLIGMLLDQQVPLERAFSAPYDLVRRLGHQPTADELAGYDPEALAAVFAERPALHRYPKSMAARVQSMAQLLMARYGGGAGAGWGGAGAASGVPRPTGPTCSSGWPSCPGSGPRRRRSSWPCWASGWGCSPRAG